MPERIVPVSSGKGGVGKTTVAVNLALSLSRYAPTILVDLDTGTSSVRNAIGVPVAHDLYHFFRKGRPLADCVTRLPDSWDPERLYGNFGFVAGPMHLIEEITNFNEEKKRTPLGSDQHAPRAVGHPGHEGRGRLTRHRLPPLRQLRGPGLYAEPPVGHFRRLGYRQGNPLPEAPDRLLAGQPVLRRGHSSGPDDAPGERPPRPGRGRLRDRPSEPRRVPGGPRERPGPHPLLHRLARTIESFRVFYVLNQFDGVAQGYETAVRPFVKNLVETVSERVAVANLGWINHSAEVHAANCSRRPILLQEAAGRRRPKTSGTDLAFDQIVRDTLGLDARKGKGRTLLPVPGQPRADEVLSDQLDILRRMYARHGRNEDPRDDFRYLASRTLHLLESGHPTEFGTPRLLDPLEIRRLFFPRAR